MSEKSRRRRVFSWMYVCPLLGLCGILGFLQYRLIDEVRDAARERLRGGLNASLNRISQEFDSEIAAAAASIAPPNPVNDLPSAEEDLRARYTQWKQTARHGQMFARIAMAVPRGQELELRSVEPAGAGWPDSLRPLRRRLEENLRSHVPGPGGAPPPDMGGRHDNEGLALELPLFPAPTAAGFVRHELGWVVLELNEEALRSGLLPEILQRHLGTDYQVEVIRHGSPEVAVYQSDPDPSHSVMRNADASVGLFDPQYQGIVRRAGFGGRGRGPIPLRGPSAEGSRWVMYVRHRAGSLEAVAARARMLNLAVTGGVLLLMIATLAALIRYTRRAQQLAELQMEFVAGVSHELRTPLTVIHTAAYNLRGKLANNPAQVERYGALIQQESGRLKELVENVLQFSSANAGRVIQEREPLSVEAVIEQALESAKTSIAGAHCVVEKDIAAGLPQILGDPVALRQAVANLVANAAKYGAAPSGWIGISASATGHNGDRAVRISVADRGPGIPAEEQAHIFDPFFRGARAVQDQVHGTGLGLSLVKKIVEAHGGEIRVRSVPEQGAEFIMTLPAVPSGAVG